MSLRPWFICMFACLTMLPSDVFSQEKQLAEKKAIDPLDWPYWRGPEMNGISREKNLPDSWSPDGENLIWSKPE